MRSNDRVATVTGRGRRPGRGRIVAVRILVLVMLGERVSAQSRSADGSHATQPDRPPFALQRDDEDWSFLRNTRSADPWDRIKFIPLTSTGDVYLSLGGELRQQYERIPHDQWGSVPQDDSGYLLQRSMFHADVRLRPQVRFFLQLKSGIESGRRAGPRPTDEDRLDFHQGFVDIRFGFVSPRRSVTLRLGRQELNFGSARLVSVREDPNVRQGFDAARAVARFAPWRIDGFVSRPVTTAVDVFDDRPDSTRAFWGLYAVRELGAAAKAGIDMYYLGLNRQQARFDQGLGDERRHTMGLRIWGVQGRLDYNVEGVWQGGRFADSGIRAWTVASDTGWRITVPGRPRIGLRADITSGDKNRNDDSLGTFNPLFPRGAYFSRVDPVGPYNHMDVHPQLDVSVAGGWRLSASWLWMWRTEMDDGVYGMAGQLLRSGQGAHERFIGHAPSVEVQKQLTRHFTIIGTAGVFTAGSFIHESEPASDMDYFTAIATYKF